MGPVRPCHEAQATWSLTKCLDPAAFHVTKGGQLMVSVACRSPSKRLPGKPRTRKRVKARTPSNRSFPKQYLLYNNDGSSKDCPKLAWLDQKQSEAKTRGDDT